MDYLPGRYMIDPRVETTASSLEDFTEFEDEEEEKDESYQAIGERFKDFLGKIRVVFIDIEGTIINNAENAEMPNTIDSIKKLRESGFKIQFVTNTIKGSKLELRYRMHKLGFDVEPHEIFTSLSACRMYLDKTELRPYLLIDKSVKSYFVGVNTEDPNCVVLGIPSTQFDYLLFSKAYKILRKGAPLITYHMGGEESTQIAGVYRMGPGPFIQMLHFLADVEPILIGKPSAEFFTYAMEQSGFKAEECVMIGDDICEDIAGSLNAGMLGILVQTGNYKPGDEEILKPALTVKDFNTAVHYLVSVRNVYLEELVIQARSSEYQVHKEAITTIKRFLSDTNPPVEPLINYGILPILINCLSNTVDPALQFEALWCLTNISAGTTAQTYAVVKDGATPLLIQLLDSSDDNVREQAAWTLGNIIGEGPELRDYAISLGVLAPLLKFIQKDNIPFIFLEIILWVIINVIRNQDPSPPLQTLQEILPVLNILIHRSADTRILADSLWALSYLSSGTTQQLQIVIDSGILPKLLSLLGHEKSSVQFAAVQVIENIAAGTDEQVQILIDSNALSHFHGLLETTSEKICKEALRALSNIMAGNNSQVQAVIDAKLIPLIISHLSEGEFHFTSTKSEAIWAISNMTGNGDKDQISYMIDCDVIPSLCCLLLVPTSNSLEIQVILKGIQNILSKLSTESLKRVCDIIVERGGLHKFHLLSNEHGNIHIQKTALEIIEDYFSDTKDTKDSVKHG